MTCLGQCEEVHLEELPSEQVGSYVEALSDLCQRKHFGESESVWE